MDVSTGKEAGAKAPRKNARAPTPAKAPRKAAPAKAAALAKTPAPRKAAPAKAPAPAATGTTPRIDRSRYQYAASDAKSASGRKTVNNGDALAKALEGKTHTEVIDLVKANGGEAKASWDNLNKGMARMSAGNMLRAMWRKVGVIVIDGKRIKAPQPAA